MHRCDSKKGVRLLNLVLWRCSLRFPVNEHSWYIFISLEVYVFTTWFRNTIIKSDLTLNMNRHYGLNVKMLNYYIYSYKWINFRNDNCDMVVGLSTQSIWNINKPPKFPKLILKNCNKFIAKNITSARSRTRISCIRASVLSL